MRLYLECSVILCSWPFSRRIHTVLYLMLYLITHLQRCSQPGHRRRESEQRPRRVVAKGSFGACNTGFLSCAATARSPTCHH